MTSEKPPRGWPRPKPRGSHGIPELSDEEVERRVELRENPAANDGGGWIPGPEPEPEAGPEPLAGPGPLASPEPAIDAEAAPTALVRSPGVQSTADRRRILWRDSATILVFVVLALLGFQAFAPRIAGTPTDTPFPSGVVSGSQQPGWSLPPGLTLGPIVDPSLGIDATPTPIPVITLGPSPSPSPRPTPRATPKTSAKPSATPTAAPTDMPPPSDAPSPAAALTD